ncbi:MAG TPA: hypothetical protein VGP63_07765, partial [Planctomycetaceae bacterium]|nr:hypothetical protein [Planctomycetaceae bacterium]
SQELDAWENKSPWIADSSSNHDLGVSGVRSCDRLVTAGAVTHPDWNPAVGDGQALYLDSCRCQKRSKFCADVRAFDSLSQLEAGFRQNV